MELRLYYGFTYLFLSFMILIFLIKHTRITDLYFNNLSPNMGCCYINLEIKPDKKEKTLHLITNQLKINPENVHKISGVYIPKNGHKGCVQAHILAINLAKLNDWDRCLILEDDARLKCSEKEVDEKFKQIYNFLDNNPWNMFMLATAFKKTKDINDDNIIRLTRASTSSAYIINKNYYDTLLECFYRCNKNMSKERWTKNGWEKWALDQQWQKLQKEDKWFCFKNDILKQDHSGSVIMLNTGR